MVGSAMQIHHILARDVTALLRGKFGLPPLPFGGGGNYRNAAGNRRRRNESPLGHHRSASRGEKSKIAPTRLSRAPRDGNRGFGRGLRVNDATNAATENPTEEDEDGVVNALVIVGKMEGPVEGYLWGG